MSRLAGLLDQVAAALGAERIATDGSVEYRRGATVLAVDGPDGTDFQLRPDLAAAALRTPSVSASRRGPAWVRFSPTGVDETVRDRAGSWLEFAWRRAGPEG
jgi:hypothetical protein